MKRKHIKICLINYPIFEGGRAETGGILCTLILILLLLLSLAGIYCKKFVFLFSQNVQVYLATTETANQFKSNQNIMTSNIHTVYPESSERIN